MMMQYINTIELIIGFGVVIILWTECETQKIANSMNSNEFIGNSSELYYAELHNTADNQWQIDINFMLPHLLCTYYGYMNTASYPQLNSQHKPQSAERCEVNDFLAV